MAVDVSDEFSFYLVLSVAHRACLPSFVADKQWVTRVLTAVSGKAVAGWGFLRATHHRAQAL